MLLLLFFFVAVFFFYFLLLLLLHNFYKQSSSIAFSLTPTQSDCHDHAHQQFTSASAVTCHCQLPGFGADLHTKSAQDAKFKILLAITLCCVFMVSKSITMQTNRRHTHIHGSVCVCACACAYVLCKRCLAHPASVALRRHVPIAQRIQHLFSPSGWRRAWRMSDARRLMWRVKCPQPVGRWLALN